MGRWMILLVDRAPFLRTLSTIIGTVAGLSILHGQALTASAQTSSQCQGPFTYTADKANKNFNLNPGESLLIPSGNFSGNISNFSAGATICVEAGATFQPGQLNNASGKIQNFGTVKFPSVAFGNGFAFDNAGTAEFLGSPNFNGPATLTNQKGQRYSLIKLSNCLIARPSQTTGPFASKRTSIPKMAQRSPTITKSSQRETLTPMAKLTTMA